MPHQHPQLCSPRSFLAPLAEVPSSQSPAPASSARVLLPCRESRCGQSSPCIPHPASLHPTSYIPHPSIPHLTPCIPPSLPHLTSCIPLSHIPQPSNPYPTSLHPASLQSHVCPSHIVSDNPKSCIPHPMPTSNPVSYNLHPSTHNPSSQIPHPTILYPTHPSSPIPHPSILNPIPHVPYPSVPYPTPQITHPTSCIPTPRIPHLSVPCLSTLNLTPHIPPSHILHPASHTPCLPIPYPTSLHPTPPLCLLMGCCTQGTHQFSMPVPKPSSSSQPSSSSSSGSKGVISAGRAGSGVQRLAARREPQTISSLLPLPRASSSSSLRTCTSVWKGRKYHLVGRGGKPALCPELGEGRKPRVAEGAPPGLWIF